MSADRTPGRVCCLVLLVLLAGVARPASAAPPGSVVIYTAGNAPRTPALNDLALKKSVSQFGITWTFAKPVRVGRFITGDWYVVGPVTVAAVDPEPLYDEDIPEAELDAREKNRRRTTLLRNGSMLNPPPKLEMAFDSGIRNWYRPGLITRFPVAMKPGDALVSSISLKQGEQASFVYHSKGARGVHDNCPIKVAAVLTCMSAPQPPDAFRPSYGDRTGGIYLARNLRRRLLPKLARPGNERIPDPVKFAEVFRKPWLNTGFFGFDQPMENMPHYGQWVGQAVSNAGLLLCLDFTPQQKERLLVNFVQVGIDYWGLVRAGHPGWQGWGGHGSGRKFPIVFAGFLLGDDKMVSPTRTFPTVEFGEDNQTRYGNCWTGAKVVFAGHSGSSSRTGKPPREKWGPYEHLHPSQWDKDGLKNNQSEAYRRANSSCCWVGQALALRILKLERQWNHDAFFDYVDRWMTEDDREHRHEINRHFPNPNLVNETKIWCHQGYTGERWIKPLWVKVRPTLRPPPDGWKTTR